MHNTEREGSIALAYHPCAKFSGVKYIVRMSRTHLRFSATVARDGIQRIYRVRHSPLSFYYALLPILNCTRLRVHCIMAKTTENQLLRCECVIIMMYNMHVQLTIMLYVDNLDPTHIHQIMLNHSRIFEWGGTVTHTCNIIHYMSGVSTCTLFITT